jgi:hypothetical protein
MRNAWPDMEVFARPDEVNQPPNGHFKSARFEQNLQNNQYGYDILWFVWDRDGPFPLDDWEPVIFFWKDVELIGVTTRPHFGWEDYSNLSYDEKHFVYPLRIIFRDSWHAGYLTTYLTRNETDIEIANTLSSLKFVPIAIAPEDVPPNARKARFSRRGFLPGFGQDIHDEATARLDELRKLSDVQ